MSADEIAKLAGRVRWLEHHRRTIRTAIGVVVAVVGIFTLPKLLGSKLYEWPRIHAWLMAVVFGIVLAFVSDIVIAAVLSGWEVRHDRLARDRGLPRAVVRRGRK